jgi:hypothetical protein
MTSIQAVYVGRLSPITSPMAVGWLFTIPYIGGQAITAESVVLSLTIRCRVHKKKVLLEKKRWN